MTVRESVFISYASEDINSVYTLADGLKSRKIETWLDKYNLKPGKWKPQIRKAIAQSKYFIICISNSALLKTGSDIDKVGFQDEELDYAYEIAQNQSDKDFKIIPVRLEDCARGDFRINTFQQYDFFNDIELILDKLAVDLGGIALGSSLEKKNKTEKEEFIESLFGKAQSAYYANDFNKSLNIIECIIDINNKDDISLSYKGSSLANLGRYAEAMLSFENAIKINPDVANHWYNKGLVLIQTRDINQAIKAFDTAIAKNPKFIQAWLDKSLAYLELGFAENALSSCENAQDHGHAKGLYFSRKVKMKSQLSC